MPTPVVYLRTYAFLGLYEPNLKEIQISEFLKQFPEFHNHVLKHEKDHAKLYEKKGFSLWHIWLEFRDRPKIILSPTLFKQYRAFNRLSLPKGRGDRLKAIVYTMVSQFTGFVVFLAPFTLCLEGIRRLKKRFS